MNKQEEQQVCGEAYDNQIVNPTEGEPSGNATYFTKDDARAAYRASIAQESFLALGVLGVAVGAIFYGAKKKRDEHKRIVAEQKQLSVAELINNNRSEPQALYEKIQETYLNDEWLNTKRFVLGPIGANIKEVWDRLSVDGRWPTNFNQAWKDTENAFDQYASKMESGLKTWGKQLAKLMSDSGELTGFKKQARQIFDNFEDYPHPIHAHVGDLAKLKHHLGRLTVAYRPGKTWSPWSGEGAIEFVNSPAGNARSMPALDRDGVKEIARLMQKLIGFFFDYQSNYAYHRIDEMDGVDDFIREASDFYDRFEQAALKNETVENLNDEELYRLVFRLQDREDVYSETQFAFCETVQEILKGLDMYINASFQK